MAGAAAGLERALLASLALHGAVLAGVSLPGAAPKPQGATPEPIAARLVEPAPPSPPKAEERAEPPLPARKAVAAPRKILDLPSKVVAAPPPVVEPAAPSAPAATVAVVHPAPAPVVAAAEPVADASAVRQYRKVFLNAAGQFKTYPDLARENSWSGDVAVAVAFGADGGAEVALRRGSGHDVLDQQALDMFRRAARAAPPPAELRGRAFRLDVRAVYGLED